MAQRKKVSTPKKRVTDDRDRALYVISIAAELSGVHPQTLRMYERKGLLRPKRTEGRARRYSERDIEHVRMIQELTQDRGINLAGVEMVMELTRLMDQMEERLDQLRREAEEMRRRMDRARAQTALVPLRDLKRIFGER
ncbi:MAG: heat shock protein transcriptional repressor HspR [Actinomycetota bacterium]